MPIDPKPDVIAISKGRFETVKTNFVQKTVQKSKKFKRAQSKLEDAWSDNASVAVST